MWHREFTDQVTWCSTATRTRPAQKNAVSAPHQDIVTNPPINAGASSVTTVSAGNQRSIRTRSRSASRSGAKRWALVFSRSNSQPMWACQKPLASAVRSPRLALNAPWVK
ncbi:hypothetical protein GCM10017567_19930 [Amycolatopsis bullii]|uniref:Uncharacterized protein n=1 Tax=Amycolatopsis bullii TaxID=941987 RepID=A0ABQ3K6G3_9PSEU|nr:hypothetical protein GCM10017567_19930 [Amycolatopsis bullii]